MHLEEKTNDALIPLLSSKLSTLANQSESNEKNNFLLLALKKILK